MSTHVTNRQILRRRNLDEDYGINYDTSDVQ